MDAHKPTVSQEIGSTLLFTRDNTLGVIRDSQSTGSPKGDKRC
jgi:hypothetical protein